MTEEQLAQRRRFAGETVPSMHRRSDSHDYTSRSFYMITLIVEGRWPLLGQLRGSENDAGIVLTPLGEEVARSWQAISTFHPDVAVIAQQVMPDHFHGILYFRKNVPGLHLGYVIRGFKTATNRAYRQLVAPCEYATTLSQPTGKGLLWEKGYNDRILHTYQTLDRWKDYLRDNPRRLLVKRLHPDLFRVQHNLQYGGLTFSAIGNRFLLNRPLKIQVQCSRRITDEELKQQRAAMLAAGAEGAVFVSPCISKGEKMIMHDVFEAGYPVIYLQENGFTDMAKPGGRRFDACSRGQMLILAPWVHHNEHVTISRSQCMALNDMARILCES